MSLGLATSPGAATLRRLLTGAGVACLLIWCGWWGANLGAGHLLGGGNAWFPDPPHLPLGVDLQYTYSASRYWLSGGDPYIAPFGDLFDRKFVFPPLALPLFAWTRFLSFHAAHVIWTIALAAFVGAGAWAATRSRERFGLPELPPVLAAALVLWSTPVVFAVDRGNCDAIVIVLLMAAAWGGAERSWRADGIAAAAFALAAGIKVYPAAAAAVAFVALGQWRRAALFALVLVTLAALTPELTGHFWYRLNGLIEFDQVHIFQGLGPTDHSITSTWDLWHGDSPLGRIPGLPLFSILVAAMGWWAGRAVRPFASDPPVVYAYYLVVMSAVTFLPRSTNDYNLIFLPLALVAVWGARDPVAIHVANAPFVLFWQPHKLSIEPPVLLAIKAVAVVGVAAGVVYHARALRAEESSIAIDAPTIDATARA